jgi:hypothetical protein
MKLWVVHEEIGYDYGGLGEPIAAFTSQKAAQDEIDALRAVARASRKHVPDLSSHEVELLD